MSLNDASSTMTIATFKNLIPKLPANISVLIRGKHGIGKSQLVKWLSSKDVFTLTLIDRRLAQMSDGDMVGLPNQDGRVTRFLPMDWFMLGCDRPVILHLDEFNRATQEVMQAAFQVVLDRELNGHALHPETRVYASVNTGSEYIVNEMDPALLRRFFVVDLEPTAKEWVNDFARDRLNPDIVSFISKHEVWLDPPKGNGVDLTQPHPTRHSWERLDETAKYIAKNRNNGREIFDIEDSLFFPMCCGFIGSNATIAFRDFIKTIDRQVTGEEIVNSYSKVRDKVISLGHEKWNMLIDMTSNVILSSTKKISSSKAENVAAFMSDLPDELKINLWTKLVAGGIGSVKIVRPVWDACKVHVLNVYGVLPGEKGIGMVPNIPFFNK